MVGYLLKNTASLHGTVSRGVCAVEDGKLRSVREALKIQLYPDGTLRDLAEGTDLSPETVVSMNFWGFAPASSPPCGSTLKTSSARRPGKISRPSACCR